MILYTYIWLSDCENIWSGLLLLVNCTIMKDHTLYLYTKNDETNAVIQATADKFYILQVTCNKKKSLRTTALLSVKKYQVTKVT